MADILVKCASCGQDHRLSEYVDPAGVTCRACGETLAVPERVIRSPLRLRHGDTLAPQSLGVPAMAIAGGPPPLPMQNADTLTTEMDDVYRVREKPKSVKAGWGVLTFLSLTGLLVGMQYLVREDASMLTTYNWVRGILGGLVYLLVVVVAFEDHLWQGLLALLIPPYCLIYALFRLDSYVIRYAFLALLAAFAAELYFIPNESVVLYTQQGVNDLIGSVEGAIQRAGDAPTFD